MHVILPKQETGLHQEEFREYPGVPGIRVPGQTDPVHDDPAGQIHGSSNVLAWAVPGRVPVQPAVTGERNPSPDGYVHYRVSSCPGIGMNGFFLLPGPETRKPYQERWHQGKGGKQAPCN